MEENKVLANICDMRDVTPIMMALPYPPTRVNERNPAYANLLSVDYCGSVSELSAIAQYINNQNRLSCDKCPMAKIILGISMAEMIHLQKLGELIYLLGGSVDFVARHRDGSQIMWTPKNLSLPHTSKEMIVADIESEVAAIKQYGMHINMINDACVNDVLKRIIKDEEYHITILKALLEEQQ